MRPKLTVNKNAWNERFLATTRGRIITSLRSGGRTVNDLAAELEMTDNGVRAQLLTLERDGLVQQRGVRQAFRKPEHLYELTSEADRFFPKAYELLLQELIEVLNETQDAATVRAILNAVGRRIGASYSESLAGKDRPARLEAALAALKDLGAIPDVDERDGTITLRGPSCALELLTTNHPEICALAQVALAEILGEPVSEQCTHDGRPRCCFVVGAPANA